MGFFLHAYPLPVDDLRYACGSRDRDLVHRVVRPRYGAELRDLIEGHADLDGNGEIVAAALEELCQALGAPLLPNDQWAPFRSDWMGRVDQALAHAGVAASVAGLVFRAPPLGGLRSSGTVVGCVEDGDVVAERARWEGWERILEPERRGAAQVVSWLDAALARRCGLVTFHLR